MATPMRWARFTRPAALVAIALTVAMLLVGWVAREDYRAVHYSIDLTITQDDCVNLSVDIDDQLWLSETSWWTGPMHGVFTRHGDKAVFDPDEPGPHIAFHRFSFAHHHAWNLQCTLR